MTSIKADYSRYFRDLEDEKAPGTVAAYTYTVRKYLSTLNGDSPSQESAEKFIDAYRDGDNSARSRARHITALRHFFMWLRDTTGEEKTYKLKLKTPYLQRTLPPFITDEEFTRMYDSAQHPKLRAALGLTFGAGLRLSEACNIPVEDINEVEGFVKVMGKRGKERYVPVEDEVILMIKVWRDHVRLYSKYLFPGIDTNRPQRRGGFQKMLRDHMRRCGIEGKSVHSLRHGAATSLYGRGLDIRQIQEFLGHENIATTAIYTHMTPGRLREKILKVKRFG